MSEEKIVIDKNNETEECEFCGSKNANLISVVNDRGGSSICLCDECLYDVMMMLIYNEQFRDFAKTKQW